MKSFGFNARVDMTVGNPVRQILLSASPLIAVNIISLFTSSLTTSIYSTCVGSVAFSVTSALTTITSLYINILAGIISSAQIYLSRCIGAGEREKIPVCVINSVYLLLFIHLTAGAALIIFATPVLRLLNIPAQIFSQSLLYFRFYIGFYFFTALSSMLISFSVCFGSVSHVFLLHIANLLLGLFFASLYLAVFRLDIVGIAITASSNGLVLSLVSIPLLLGGRGWRKKLGDISAGRSSFRPDAEVIKNVLSKGLLIAAQTVFVSIGGLYTTAVINKNLSVNYIATLSMSFPLTSFFASISTASSVYFAQNYGKGDFDRVKKGIRGALTLQLLYSAFCMAAFSFLSGWYFRLIGFDGEILALVVTRYRWYALSMPFLAVIYVFRYALDSFGFSKYSVFAGLCELLGYILSASLLIPAFGEAAASSIYTVSWTLSSVYLVSIYLLKRGVIYRKREARG